MNKILTIKVKNLDTGVEVVHEDMTENEMEWIRLNPNLKVEIVEVLVPKGQRKKR